MKHKAKDTLDAAAGFGTAEEAPAASTFRPKGRYESSLEKGAFLPSQILKDQALDAGVAAQPFHRP
ncbi:MAG: hypothetical protein CNCCGFBP_00196 [Fimbriimonadaceae bacterium]|nr:hypothetical protein [Fimbriimonadaceae bacterium]